MSVRFRPRYGGESGDRLISLEAAGAQRKLLPLATIITLNLPEAEVLYGQELKDEAAILQAGKLFKLTMA